MLINPYDGMQISSCIYFNHGSNRNYHTSSDAMYFDGYEKVYIGFRLAPGANPFNSYEDRVRITKIDISTRNSEVVEYYYYQDDWFG